MPLKVNMNRLWLFFVLNSVGYNKSVFNLIYKFPIEPLVEERPKDQSSVIYNFYKWNLLVQLLYSDSKTMATLFNCTSLLKSSIKLTSANKKISEKEVQVCPNCLIWQNCWEWGVSVTTRLKQHYVVQTINIIINPGHVWMYHGHLPSQEKMPHCLLGRTTMHLSNNGGKLKILEWLRHKLI